MMAIPLMLVVAVAAFSIVAMLVMVVTDKRTEHRHPRTLGASPGRVVGVFLSQGLCDRLDWRHAGRDLRCDPGASTQTQSCIGSR